MGRVVAALALFYGATSIAMGLSVASGIVVEPQPGAYLGSKSSGKWIDNGFVGVLFAIICGILTEISKSVASKPDD